MVLQLYAVQQKLSPNNVMPFTRFGTILTIFAKSMYYFDFDKSTIALQPRRNEELCHFPILIERYRVPQLLWCVKSHRN